MIPDKFRTPLIVIAAWAGLYLLVSVERFSSCPTQNEPPQLYLQPLPPTQLSQQSQPSEGSQTSGASPASPEYAPLQPLDAARFKQCMQTPEDRSQMDPYYAKGGDPGFQMKLDYLIPGKSVVFDVGGNKGGFAGFATSFQLYLFEPVQEFYDFLRNKFPSATAFKFGIGKREEDAYIVLEGENGSASSQFRKGQEEIVKGEKVRIRTLHSAMQEARVAHIDLLNINCEGCEFDIMESIIELDLARFISNIQVQFHPGVVTNGTARRCLVREHLAKTHKEAYNIDWIWERWTRK